MANTPPVRSGTTGAYYAQAVLSFALALGAMVVGIAFLDTDAWIRAFLGLGMLYLVTSAFTLAKVVRDRQDETRYTTRIDQARLDKLLSEHDPFRVDAP
ncbi:YiaA/YiaB family inner membrane protein [Streptacidiphilus anmyonensis]|uniref:YiaA/YiaB family inner membrane protein n=1 Tax=Streptacidiphilus anmyonensis TaxID=405782 RepID=UPI0005A80B0E|nr:YiaA/YiaB family inner membrane protein [Streptacidiphilus anmyonensis]